MFNINVNMNNINMTACIVQYDKFSSLLINIKSEITIVSVTVF